MSKKATVPNTKTELERPSKGGFHEKIKFTGNPRQKPKGWKRTSAAQIVDTLLERVTFRRDSDLPPDMSLGDPDKDLEHHASGDPFGADHYALKKGHHPKLRQAVKGSVYEPTYRRTFGEE